MTIREAFQQYWDGNNLLAPAPVPSGTIKGSGNGIMYTSEFYIMLAKYLQLTDQDKIDFANKIEQCIRPEGMLCRVPIAQNSEQEGPDDLYGVLDACMALGNTTIPRKFLWCIIKYLGFLNNVNPGKWTASSFLIRQPQLFACIVAASFPSWKNPLHILIRTCAMPLFWFSALIIAISCMFTPTNSGDPRRLGWHLMQTLKPVSITCWLASRVFLWRLYRQYGPTGMEEVASQYYQPNGQNPYSEYWVTD